MTSGSRVVSLFVMVALSACAKVEQPITGTTGTGGGPGTGNGGTVGAGGGGVATGTGGDMRGTMGAGGMGGEAMCGMQFFQLTRQPPDVMLVLDRSASMKADSADVNPTDAKFVPPSKWDQVVPALTEVIPLAGANISWGMKNFPEDGAACAAATVTTKIDVPVSQMNSAAIVAAIRATLPEGNGTPTGPAVAVAATYLRSLTDTNPKYILLATDGQPSCGGSAGALVEGTDGARMSAVAAVTAAAASGIHTFVVGVATTKENDTATLNMLAVAGLEPRADPNPLATRFYLATTKAELVTAMQAIAAKVDASCVFPLSSPPPVPENIAVKVNGVKAPADTSNSTGWNYTGPDHRGVEVFGSWCEMIKTSANMVEIIFGCPDIPIP